MLSYYFLKFGNYTIVTHGWLRREMGGSVGRWVAKQGDGWLRREICAKKGDEWLKREIGG
jgi:hypothetical protein